QRGAGEEVGRWDADTNSRYIELVGPQILTHDEILRTVMRSFGRHRPLLHVPRELTRKMLQLQEWYLGPGAPATWDEAVLMEHSSVATRGTADVEALGVQPMEMALVLGG
ncbi:MAG: hypothetical protein JJE27_07365, partial [Thermoleophilia bacterium]|nr:hypothetical protein [Thermoleophilia bacterium]